MDFGTPERLSAPLSQAAGGVSPGACAPLSLGKVTPVRDTMASLARASRQGAPWPADARRRAVAPGDGTGTLASESPSIERRLAAIAFADVAGFSRLVGQDDVRTTLRWRALRHDLLEPKIAEHRGRLLRVVGDALFIEFASAVDAVRWAHDVQRIMAEPAQAGDGEPLQLRIGINVDDVLVDGDDLHGDGVNIAARVQALAQPGETLVTAAVYAYVLNKIGIAMTDLGEHPLKNIARPVRMYRVEAVEPEAPRRAATYLAWSKRPWIAVLPFRNLGGNSQEDYFGEGITEDIITALSRTGSLSVIARNSTLRYRDRHAASREIAAELGVRYLVEGSVRRQASRLRISSELIDASRNEILWGDKYEGANDDLFDFQDQIATSIVTTIEPRVYAAEAERARSKPTENLDAYDCLLRVMPLLHTFDRARWKEASDYLDRALALDPAYARAHAHKAWLSVLSIGEGGALDIPGEAARAKHHVQQALAADSKDAFVLSVAAHVHAFLHKEMEVAIQLYDEALAVNQNSAFAWGMSGITFGYLNEPEAALDRFRRAWRLSPFDPYNYFFLVGAGLAEFIAGRYDEAIGWLRKTIRANPRFLPGHRHLVTALANAGRDEEARAAAAALLALEPGFSVATLESWYPLRPAENLKRYVSGLRAAGLPE